MCLSLADQNFEPTAQPVYDENGGIWDDLPIVTILAVRCEQTRVAIEACIVWREYPATGACNIQSATSPTTKPNSSDAASSTAIRVCPQRMHCICGDG